jgi:hypothetical protein
MVLRKISVPMRQELTWGWRKLHVDIFMICRRFQVTAEVWMNPFRVVTQHMLVVYLSFGTVCRSHLQVSRSAGLGQPINAA